MSARCGRRPSLEWRAERFGGLMDGDNHVILPGGVVHYANRVLGTRAVPSDLPGLYDSECPICGIVTGPRGYGCSAEKHAAYYDAFPRGEEVPR